LRAAIPVKVEGDHDPVAGKIAAQVVAEGYVVRPPAIAERDHDVILLQLGQRGRARTAVEYIGLYDPGFREQVVLQSGRRYAAVGMNNQDTVSSDRVTRR
jgi:hypothetical protein